MTLLVAFMVGILGVWAHAYITGVTVEEFQATRTYKILRWIGISLFCENGMLSKGAVIASVSFILFIFGSLYLMLNNINWPQYPTFASITGGGGALTQMVNKGIAAYRSAGGPPPAKGGDGA